MPSPFGWLVAKATMTCIYPDYQLMIIVTELSFGLRYFLLKWTVIPATTVFQEVISLFANKKIAKWIIAVNSYIFSLGFCNTIHMITSKGPTKKKVRMLKWHCPILVKALVYKSECLSLEDKPSILWHPKANLFRPFIEYKVNWLWVITML